MSLFNRSNEAVAQVDRQPARRAIVPRYDVREDENAFVVTAFVPGVERSAVETTVNGDSLTVLARRGNLPSERWTPVYRESLDADYRLVLELDRRFNREGVKAELSQGILTLTIPKAEAVKPRRIEIAG
jgi:HSP20 family molecular chaperone IbpA